MLVHLESGTADIVKGCSENTKKGEITFYFSKKHPLKIDNTEHECWKIKNKEVVKNE